MSVPLRCTRDIITDINLSYNTDLDLKPMTISTLRLRKADSGMNSTISPKDSTGLRLMMMFLHTTQMLLMLLKT